MVDRSEPRPGGDQQRQAELAGQVAHGKARGERHEQASDPLDDHDRRGVIRPLTRSRGGRRRGRGSSPREQRGRIDRLAGELGREVR